MQTGRGGHSSEGNNLVITICTKAFITYVSVTVPVLIFSRPMYLGEVFCSDISRHKTGTNLITKALLFLRLSPFPYPQVSRWGNGTENDFVTIPSGFRH